MFRSALTRLSAGLRGALLLGFAVLSAGCEQDKGIGDSKSLVRAILERAKSSETVDLAWLGDKVCFVAESLPAVQAYAEEWFPGYKIRTNHFRNESEGVWHIVVSNEKERVVRIYSIDQRMLQWNVPEETKIADAAGCTSTVKVIVSGSSAEIFIGL